MRPTIIKMDKKKLEELNYKIYCNSKLVACFLYQQDRDMCRYFLQDAFEYNKYTTEKVKAGNKQC